MSESELRTRMQEKLPVHLKYRGLGIGIGSCYIKNFLPEGVCLSFDPDGEPIKDHEGNVRVWGPNDLN